MMKMDWISLNVLINTPMLVRLSDICVGMTILFNPHTGVSNGNFPCVKNLIILHPCDDDCVIKEKFANDKKWRGAYVK